MSEYIMDPGARLVVGPRGHLDETLGRSPMGACCSACAKQPLGAEVSASLQRAAIPTAIIASAPGPGVTTTTPPAVRTATIVGLGVVALVGVMVVRKMRRRRR